jgi:hypothetical protein
MAARWYPPLVALLTPDSSSVGGAAGGTSEGTSSGTTTGTTAGTSSGTTTGTSVAGTSGGTTTGTSVGTTTGGTTTDGSTGGPALHCVPTLTIVSSWPGGYQATVTITCNTPVTSWRVTITGAQITQIWNAGAVTTSGTTTVVGSAAWNGTIPAGGSASFGFIATGSPTPPPVLFE